MRERLKRAYLCVEYFDGLLRLMSFRRCLTLAMQSGSFIQLLVTLIAVISRMNILLSELSDSVQITCTTCERLLQNLNVCNCFLVALARRDDQFQSLQKYTLHIKKLQATRSAKEKIFARARISQLPRLPRNILLLSLRTQACKTRLYRRPFSPQPIRLQVGPSDPCVDDYWLIAHLGTILPEVPVSELLVTGTPDQADKSKRKKHRKNWDEIDEIFGF